MVKMVLMRWLKHQIREFLHGTDRKLLVAALLLAWLTAYKFLGLI